MIGYLFTTLNGSRWRRNQGGLFPLSPPDSISDLSKSQASDLVGSSQVVFLRWESAFDQADKGPWWHVIKDAPDTLGELPKKTRYMIRKALNVYEARPIQLQDIVDQGYHVYMRAYERYQTHERMLSEHEFSQAVKALPHQTEWWGVYELDTQRLVAFSENYVEKGTCFYVSMWLEPEAMEKYSGYLLFHEMELHYLHDRGFRYVSDGARSLSHDTNIHDFLIRKFKFRKAYAQLHVVYVPWLGACVAAAFPFRNLIKKLPLGPFKKASVLLKQEEIRRECVKRTG